MNKVVTWLSGKKTYLVALGTWVTGVVSYYQANNHNWRALVNYLLVGGGLAALRAAFAKGK